MNRMLRPIALLLMLAASWTRAEAPASALNLNLRSRVESAPGSGRLLVKVAPAAWDPAKTAVVVCDMWDNHWCAGATRRVGEMAPRMNEVIVEARKRGALIIHCPSDTMPFYEGTPQRAVAKNAPVAETKVPLQRWCRIDPVKEGKLPIDDSDGGCDCEPQCKNYRAWKRQIDVLKIEAGDAITDSAEAYHLMKQRGIANVIVMGVHTNMCVLGRPFSIRQMAMQGMNVALVRDLTDTMYNPRRAPRVSHFSGTDLVVEHIERHWCPTVLSTDFIGGSEFRSPDDKRPHVAIVCSEDEYKTETTVPEFANKHLLPHCRLSYVFFDDKNRDTFVGLHALAEADAAILSIRRRTPTKEQLDVFRKFLAAGKPLVAIRTTSHAFCLAGGKKPAAGKDEWPTFDREVVGCFYRGHHSSKGAADTQRTRVSVVADAAKNPILGGWPEGTVAMSSWMYRTTPLSEEATALLMGKGDEGTPDEPVAWTFIRKDGGRTFATSLGAPSDFESTAFRRLLVNGLYWSLKQPAPPAAVLDTLK